MQDTLEPASGAPRDASTVVLLRDGPAGLEVFLMKRSGLSDTFGEAYVFPGGKLDAHDSTPAAVAALDVPAHTLARQLDEPELWPRNPPDLPCPRWSPVTSAKPASASAWATWR